MEEKEKQGVRVDISNLLCYSCSTHFFSIDNFKSHQCSNVSKSTTMSTSPTKKYSSPPNTPSPIHQDSETETENTHANDDVDVPSPSLPEIKEEEEEEEEEKENSEVENEDEDWTKQNINNNNNNKRKRVRKSKKKPPTYPVADPSNVEFPFLTCPTCFRIFNRPNDMKKHMLLHGQKTQKCIKCNYSCWSRPNLYFHMKQKHPGVHPYRCYKYPTCLETFATREELQGHSKTHRTERYYCPEPGCTRSYGSNALVTDHLNSHKNIRPHICEKCAAPFETVAQLKKHYVSHRTPSIKCDFEGCSKLFKSVTLLKSHQASHSSERLYKCTESGCGASYTQKKRLKQHVKVMHKKEEENLCSFCGKSFLRKCHFDRHILSHSQEKNVHCTFQGCSLSFADKAARTRHMRTHTGERNHQCGFPSCGKKFSSSDTRKRHEQTHTQAKPFVCAFCPQAFHDNRMLKKHVLSYHEEEEFDITVPLSYRAKEST